MTENNPETERSAARSETRINRGYRILCPNGHLGFAPTRTGSFEIGLTHEPNMIACDSGSCDCGPVPLGSNGSSSPVNWQKHDIEVMLVGARKLGIPMMIGSAGDTGTNKRVDLFVSLVKEIAREHGMAKFKLGYFYSDVPRARVEREIKAGRQVRGLDGRADLTLQELEATDQIVAVAGVHPYIKLLDEGADVVIGGRSSDCAIFAAPAIRKGYPEALAYFYGKIMECASFCAEPYGGKESVLGEITHDDVKVTAMLPEQRCTVASVSAHAMYERGNPFYEHFLGGHIDMRDCVYEQYDERTTRVMGPRFIADTELRVKLEGAGKVGERFIGLVGVRDPTTIARIDEVIAWSRNEVRKQYGQSGYELAYNVYGRDAILGAMEPNRNRPVHEICVLIQGIARDRRIAEDITMIAYRQMFYARLPNVKGTAGGVAFALDEVLPASPAYRWTLNHTMRVEDPLELFEMHLVEVGD
jgi:hypothetical protein